MAIVLHPLANLSNAWPPFFVDNLLQVYTHGKSGLKFQILRNQLIQSLPSAPPPGPATFIANCLEFIQHIGPPHDEGLCHMMISALCESDRSNWPYKDEAIARRLAGSLFCKALAGRLNMESRIVVKLPVAFHFDLKDLGDILSPGRSEEVLQWRAAKDFVEQYLVQLLKRRLYTGALSLIKSFNFQTCNYQALIATIVDDGQPDVAVDWAEYLGKDMLKFLVQHCTESNFFKVAYKVVKQYNLEAEFPDAYHLYKKSYLQKLAAKGLWNVAQSVAEGDPILIDYLVMLAIESKDAEMVEELSEIYNLDISPIIPGAEDSNLKSQFLQLESVMSIDDVYWIDTLEGLQFAERAISDVKLVGIDCEWKPVFAKKKTGKVSILQVAFSERVLILDLIRLAKNCQSSLNSFIEYLFHSPEIVKIGYAVHNDLAMLSSSYSKKILAFRHCKSVLDLRSVIDGRVKGGLSGLAKETLGISLDKQVRMSNWETRPLRKKQLYYAALDAAVLLVIFRLLPEHSRLGSAIQGWEQRLKTFGKINDSGAVPLSDRRPEQIADETNYGGQRFSVRNMEQACINLTITATHEDLVLASCELLGIPVPGLMKNELFEFTRAAKLMRPVFKTTLACHKETAFYSFVRLNNTTFLGRISPSKKDAEFWAAHAALSKLSIGVKGIYIGHISTIGECYAEGLSILQACSDKSRCGCLQFFEAYAKRGI